MSQNPQQSPVPDHLIWLDLEMTGLDPDTDKILEIATVITDKHLNIVAEGPILAIFQPEAALLKMDSWCTKQHNKTGLVNRVKASTVDEAHAEGQTLEFVMQYVPKGKSPMCGSSICQDRRFLYRWMPKLEQYFHYRNLDVSTVKELARHWKPSILKNFKKKSNHVAMDDIKDSISELLFYKNNFFNF